MNNVLGVLNTTSGPMVNFTAGSASGMTALFVNATLNSNTVQSTPVWVTVSSNVLRTVTVSPISADVVLGGTQGFTASATCSQGTCPSGTVFTWALTSTLGSLSSGTAGTVTFTAGNTAGKLSLFVNGTLNGVTKEAGPIPIVIAPVLSLVTVTPATANISYTSQQTFTAAISCTGGACPAGTTFVWSYPSNLGTLNTTTGRSVTFTAGSTTGTGSITVTATLNGKAVSSTPVSISVYQPSSSSSSGSGTILLVLIIVVVVVVVAVVVAVLMIRRGKRSKPTYTPPQQMAPWGAPPPAGAQPPPPQGGAYVPPPPQ